LVKVNIEKASGFRRDYRKADAENKPTVTDQLFSNDRCLPLCLVL